jgi:hypothetical protein
MNSNRSSNQSQGKANGKNRPRTQKNKSPKGGNPPGTKAQRTQRPKGGKQKQASAAAAYATGQVGKAPVITMSRDMCRIVHRELIASVTGSTAFTVAQTIALQPGLAASFPWLSIMAQGWEQYRFRKLKYCYYTRTGSNIPGSVMLAPDYDAADAAPATEQIASSYEDVAEDAPWKDIECNLTPSAMLAGKERLFTRSGALAANLDVKTYDAGNLFVCSVDGTAVNWGKLWVEYDIEFYVPQLPATGQLALVGGSIAGATAQTAANPFGTAPVVDAQSAGITMSNASVLTFGSAGTFVVACVYNGTVITAVANPTAAGGATLIGQSSVINAAATAAIWEGTYTVSAPGATLAFSLTATTVTVAGALVGSAPAGSLA